MSNILTDSKEQMPLIYKDTNTPDKYNKLKYPIYWVIRNLFVT